MTEDYKKYFREIKPNPDPETKQAIRSDRWDRMRLDQVTDEVKEFVLAHKQLGVEVPTGFEAMGDTFMEFMKAAPTVKPAKDVRPSYWVNRAVAEEVMGLDDFEELRQGSVGDPVGAALAAVAMEPQLEKIFDKFKEAQKRQEELENMLQGMEAIQVELRSLEDVMSSMEEISDVDLQDFSEQKALLEEQMEMLQDQAAETTEDLAETLAEEMDDARPIIADAVKEALEEAGLVGGFDGWGLGQGGLKKMPVAQRLELARKLASAKFKKMTEIFGRIQRTAIAAQLNKVVETQDEIYDVELGNDLPKVLPSDMLGLHDEVLLPFWFNKYHEHGLQQYALHGEEKVAKGGVFLCVDGSGSMHGDPNIWAKGIGLALMKVAMMQHRPFYAVDFGGTGEFKCYDFDTSTETLKVKTHDDKGRKQELSGIQAVVDYAEAFYNGGTDFMTPLSLAMAQMEREHEEFGGVQADIVFVTDGYCAVTDSFKKKFKEVQDRLGFKMYGIAIGVSKNTQPLNDLCDGKVIEARNLTDGSDLVDLFGVI